MRWPTRITDAMHRRHPSSDRGAAMMLVMTFMIFIMGITIAVVSILIAQGPAVYQAERGSQTIYAAQSGLQVALGQIRSAATGAFGDTSKLPCSIDGSLGGGDAADYSVEIRYYMVDPTNMTEAQRNAATYYSCSTLPGTPYFALLTASGTGVSVPGLDDDAGNRSLEAVYTFKVTNVNIPGGPIHNIGGTHCLSAVSAAVNSKIRFRTLSQCELDGETRTSWVYDTTWQLKLASTIGTATELCITGPVSGTGTQDAQLRKCELPSASARWNQLWSWTGDYSWRGQRNPVSSGPSNTCLAPTNESSWATGYLQVRSADCTGDFSPSSRVGAGAASKSTNQIVNYKQFGRCMDVTSADINATFQIAYPCKQDPTGTGANILWNHKWVYDEPATGAIQTAPQQIKVTNGANQYCLQTPSTGVNPAYPVFKACSGWEAKQKWVRFGDTGSYSTSYLFVDTYGRCIAVNPADTYNGWAKLVVTTCTNALEQKWNAPSATNDSTLGSYKEIG